jgi:hypothetical protein
MQVHHLKGNSWNSLLSFDVSTLKKHLRICAAYTLERRDGYTRVLTLPVMGELSRHDV